MGKSGKTGGRVEPQQHTARALPGGLVQEGVLVHHQRILQQARKRVIVEDAAVPACSNISLVTSAPVRAAWLAAMRIIATCSREGLSPAWMRA
jgi:hypothetical protein